MNIFKKLKAKREEAKRKATLLETLKYVLPVVLALIIFLVVKFGIMNGNYQVETIDFAKYNTLFNNKKDSLVYLTTKECDTCGDTTTLLKRVLKGSGIKTYELNIGEISDEDLSKLFDMSDETKEGIITPAFILIKQGKIDASLIWPFEEDDFINFLKDNKIVD